MSLKEVSLPSGAILKIGPAPFAEAKELFQAIVKESKAIPVTIDTDRMSLYKDMFCAGFSSREIERLVWVCLARCTYNGLKIVEDTFEPVAARQDYIKVIAEVVKENVSPFMTSLFVEFKTAMSMIENILESKAQTTTSSSTSDSARQAMPEV